MWEYSGLFVPHKGQFVIGKKMSLIAIVKKNKWMTSAWLWIPLIVLMAGIFGETGTTGVLTEKAAKKACVGVWQDSSIMGVKGDLDYEKTLIAKTGENQFNIIIHYRFNGYPRSYPCDVFLSNGEIKITTYK